MGQLNEPISPANPAETKIEYAMRTRHAEEELKKAGWIEVRTYVWQAPSNMCYVGANRAYALMLAHPELNVKPIPKHLREF